MRDIKTDKMKNIDDIANNRNDQKTQEQLIQFSIIFFTCFCACNSFHSLLTCLKCCCSLSLLCFIAFKRLEIQSFNCECEREREFNREGGRGERVCECECEYECECECEKDRERG